MKIKTVILAILAGVWISTWAILGMTLRKVTLENPPDVPVAATVINDAPATFKERFPASDDVFKPLVSELARVVGAPDIPVAEAPKVLLPLSYGERHITDWSRLFGGATPDAKVVRTIVISAPAK